MADREYGDDGWCVGEREWWDLGQKLLDEDPSTFKAVIEIVRELAERSHARSARSRMAHGSLFSSHAPAASA